MEALKQILQEHAIRYPAMEPADAVKLIYQNEFGGGHMIRDTESCMAYLRQEYENTPPNPHLPRCEDIGNGIVRIHLAAVAPEELEQLGRDFIYSATRHQGQMSRFLEKLEVLRAVARHGNLPFNLQTLDAYLTLYAKDGYPMVSHSSAYRQAYRPAYRVILK